MVIEIGRKWEQYVTFDLTEDEEMLKALAERFVLDHYDHDSRRTFQAAAPGFSRDNWLTLGELGLLGAPLPVECGGLGLDATGIATLFEALGHGIVVEPVAESMVLAARLFAVAAPPELREQWSDALISGTRRFAVAHAEYGHRDGHVWVHTTAQSDGDGFVLNGTKPFCVTGSGADAYIVSARTGGDPGEAEGVELFMVPTDTPGLAVTPWPMVDGTYAACLKLDEVRIPALFRLNGGLAQLAEADLLAMLARSAEALGVMQRLFADTRDYLCTREQFGAPIGSFQAIQHRMVAQYAVIEQSRALINLALVSSGPEDFARAVLGARAFLAERSVELGHEMIQFHGGMGVTEELAIGAGHKRLLMLSRWPEAPDATLDRFAESLT
ncbi:acyl-CoA dehydrogenase family protein [Sphingobium subterraneum]|uniref:Alkylation response protein AidB-like acyl-CoA dehydrogenase n=1 Tax=Sphingobium subterraneum TaxID=627688 RepID=A0A841IZI9_9SPHN|nr:acyl-CoA dehydrogenase [Sphingobium subterraneum]MBB6123997.1 alkylation response protein AidB-like acyl-CoA dehydrogenase [Sphingobium subterraneum]